MVKLELAAGAPFVPSYYQTFLIEYEKFNEFSLKLILKGLFQILITFETF